MACVTSGLHTITLSDDGTVYAFGDNYNGQLGLGEDVDEQSFPVPITLLPKIKMVSCGAWYTVCVDFEGFVWSFGNNQYGQLGTEGTDVHANYSPKKILNIPPIQSIYCGGFHTLMITNDNNLWTCGVNSYGELCLENLENQSKPQQTSFSNISTISASSRYSLFQTTSGEIYLGGENILNLENDKRNNVYLLPTSSEIIQFCCGELHSLLLDIEGKVYCFGSNDRGQLGLGHSNTGNKVHQISGIPSIKYISCVGSSSYLLDFDGHIWSFGDNRYSQLGVGCSRAHSSIPTKIEDLLVSQISSGCFGKHFLAKDFQGQLFGMGCSTHGQIALGIVTKIPMPQQLKSEYSNIWGDSTKSWAKSARK